MTGKEELQELLGKVIHTTHSTIDKRQQYKEPSKLSWWDRVARPSYEVFEEVSKLDVYKDALTAISKSYKVEKNDVVSYLRTLIMRVAINILQGKVKTTADSSKYIVALLKDLDKEEQEFRAEVLLKGLTLHPRSIQLDTNVRLRRPTRKDFKRREEPPAFRFHMPKALARPTAFIHTRVYAKEDTKAENMLHIEIEREIAILSLFRVGAVQDIEYIIDTDSMIYGESIFKREQLLGRDCYLITNKDVKPLKTFWANMKRVELPTLVPTGKLKEPNELSIAFERYNDSLEEGTVEKRISSAVMGLEALYLSPSEQQEMSYRLRMRAGKLLSLIDYNPDEVRKNLIDAYDIRSTYVHGGILKQKDKRKYERKHGDLNDFSKAIIDYLRASIVALLKRPGKTSLIQKIDDSFLDSRKEEEIRKLLFMPYEKEVS